MLDSIEFLKAAELLLNRATGISLSVYFLFGRAIELALKAFLLHDGMSAKQLTKRDFGHNLFALLQEAEASGLSNYVALQSPERAMIEVLSSEYQGTRLGYRVSGATYYLPPIDHTEEIARSLVSGLRELCESVSTDCDVNPVPPQHPLIVRTE